MKDFGDAKEILKNVDRAEAARLGTKVDWDDPADVADARAAVSRDERIRKLDAIVGRARECPLCGGQKIGLRQWVIRKDGKFAVCKGCYQKRIPKRFAGSMESSHMMLLPQIRYRVSGVVFSKVLDYTGMSIRELSRRSGICHSKLSKLLAGSDWTISEAEKVALENALLGR